MLCHDREEQSSKYDVEFTKKFLDPFLFHLLNYKLSFSTLILTQIEDAISKKLRHRKNKYHR